MSLYRNVEGTRRQHPLPRLADTLAACVRWRTGDLEDILKAEIEILARTLPGSPPASASARPATARRSR